MHIININLHNSKTLWFSVLKFRQHVRIDLLYVRAKFQNFSSLHTPPPPPPRPWDRQKSPTLLGLRYSSHYLCISSSLNSRYKNLSFGSVPPFDTQWQCVVSYPNFELSHLRKSPKFSAPSLPLSLLWQTLRVINLSLIIKTAVVIDPYISVEIFGIPADCKEERTKTVPHNGKFKIYIIFSLCHLLFPVTKIFCLGVYRPPFDTQCAVSYPNFELSHLRLVANIFCPLFATILLLPDSQSHKPKCNDR